MFYYEREPDPAWQADLERIAPKSDKANWLEIVWYPGEPYEPVQRWVLYEVMPLLDRVPEGFLEDIKGPDPKVDGYWKKDDDIDPVLATKKTLDGTPMRWHSNSVHSHIAWKLFRKLGEKAYPLLTWIIQGSKGGHLWQLGQTELGILEGHGIQGADTPCPGELPYADYDPRVSAKLAERDKLRRWRQSTAWDDRGMKKTAAGLWVRGDRKAAEEDYNRRVMKWLEDQIETAWSDLSRVNLPQPSEFKDPNYVVEDEDEIDREFIEDTATTVKLD